MNKRTSFLLGYTKYRFWLAIMTVAMCFLYISIITNGQTNKPLNAILISWDGVQYEHLKECLARKELPNLQKIIDSGSFIPMWVYHVTDTKAGHSEMLSGYPPDVTEVYSNSNFKPVPDGYSIFSRLETAYGDDNIITVMLTGKSHHIGSLGANETGAVRTLPRQQQTVLIQRISNLLQLDSAQVTLLRQRLPQLRTLLNTTQQSDTAQALRLRQQLQQARARQDTTRQNLTVENSSGEPWFFEKQNMDVWNGDKQRNAEIVGPQAVSYLDQYKDKRFFMFFHFSDPDTKGHQFGENSQEYTNAIILCDAWLGKIVDALKKNKIYDNTMIYITTDHGFNEGTAGHNFDPDIWLSATDKGLLGPGAQGDIIPTVLTRFDINITALQPAYPGHNLFTKRDVPLKRPERTIRKEN